MELGEEDEAADVAVLGSAEVLALEAVVPVELVDPYVEPVDAIPEPVLPV